MIDIEKIELNNPPDNSLLNLFSVRICFTNWIIPYPSHFDLVKIKVFRYNMNKQIVQHIE